MKVYCTSKNTGPSWQSDPVIMLYLGTSVKEAETAVGNFSRYAVEEDRFPVNFPEIYSAIPRSMEREMIQFFSADGWWYSIVMFDLEESK